MLILFWAILGWLFVVVAICLASQHKKTRIKHATFVGEQALTVTALSPEGSVLVQGELWRARSRNGNNVASKSSVIVTGISDHLLLVEQA